MKLNWRYWRMMWRVDFERYWGRFLTPWFMVELRSGVDDSEDWYWNRWRGLRVYWHHTPNWEYTEGSIMFHEGDRILGPDYWPQQIWKEF